MTDLRTDGTYNGRKVLEMKDMEKLWQNDPDADKVWVGPVPEKERWGDGYVMHSGMLRFRCPKCGCVHFKCYPQSAPADRSKTWTWEYVCAECGQGMGLTIKGDE